ncbi:MAG: CCA tRNA nucleotidyltransferase [Planctomycetota bacterium]|nr:CCA tRNA nucleotidyltransferase [Planctomycetota bacterium]
MSRTLLVKDLFEKVSDSSEYRGALEVLDILRGAGFSAYIVGGAVRDAFIVRVMPGREELLEDLEFDIATDAPYESIEELFEHVVHVGRKFGVARVVREEGIYEVARFRTESGYKDGRRPGFVKPADIAADAARRDLTINSLFFDPFTGELFDMHGGIRDISGRVVEFVGNAQERVREDHLRMMRAIRFSAQLNFKLSDSAFSAIRDNSHLIERISEERVAHELEQMLICPQRRMAMELFSQSGLMQHILPEVEAMKGVRQPPKYHPEGDVFTHTMILLDHLPDKCSFGLALAGLLHDIGKPSTFSDSGKIRFYGHETEGGRMSREVCDRLKLPAKLREKVAWLVENHMKYSSVRRMRKGRAIAFLRSKWGWDSLILYKADVLASFGDLTSYNYCLKILNEMKEKPEAYVKGTDVIEKGVPQGPMVGKVLEASCTEQLEGKYKNRQDALEDLPRLIEKIRKGEE